MGSNICFHLREYSNSTQHKDCVICWVGWGRMTLQEDLQELPMSLCTRSFGERLRRARQGQMKRIRCKTGFPVPL